MSLGVFWWDTVLFFKTRLKTYKLKGLLANNKVYFLSENIDNIYVEYFKRN